MNAPGDATDGIDNNNNGQIDEEGEFVASSESSIFIPQGSVALIDFNSSTKWINAAMLGQKRCSSSSQKPLSAAKLKTNF